MSSPVLLNLLRCGRFSVGRQTLAAVQSSLEASTQSGQVNLSTQIQRFGGFLSWNSVGQANVNGRLAMTRSIGDFHLKSSGVIAEPETRRLSVQHANDSFLALTTDGINFLLSDQEICDVINQCQDPTEAAEIISQQALQYGSEDNATIVIIPFGAWGKHKSSTKIYSMSRNFASSGRWA
ncbi:PREDICTED: protein phosphatase 1K, mitochondrial-like [Cyprinodon variegatus]|uniref:protein phosphatase 1K, mitochondrial-like n=1 Tax=Cyprinodon variegatus TaxID=28743 RepID=UPI000742C977|nr:PREDICTED: protein phosphatase 1K, mitochondrial-like [Cyprinodon variegatus]